MICVFESLSFLITDCGASGKLHKLSIPFVFTWMIGKTIILYKIVATIKEVKVGKYVE